MCVKERNKEGLRTSLKPVYGISVLEQELYTAEEPLFSSDGMFYVLKNIGILHSYFTKHIFILKRWELDE